MRVYVNLKDDFNSEIENISTEYGQYEVVQDNIIIDFSKLPGYYLKLDELSNTYGLLFDENRYEKITNEKLKEQSIKQANEMIEKLAQQNLLKNATDEQAYIMKYLYSEWDKNGFEYKKGDRLLYKDKFYKVLKDHVSNAEWTPSTNSLLFIEITSNNEEGDIDNAN